MPRCQVEVTGKDGRVERLEVEATSVFDAGYQALQRVRAAVVVGRCETDHRPAGRSGVAGAAVQPERMEKRPTPAEVNAMDASEIIQTTIPHSCFGAPDCCGCLNGIAYGGQAVIVCNECWAVVRTGPAAELEHTIHEMELSLDVATARCPHCGAVHIAPGSRNYWPLYVSSAGKALPLPARIS